MQISFLNTSDLPTIDYRTIIPLQGNLASFTDKSYEKLKQSLTKFGSFLPFYVWQNEGTPTLLDGHGRLHLFGKEDVNDNGNYLHPCLMVAATSLQEAKEKLLVIKSQYHNVTPEGFKEFTADMDIDWLENTVNFDELFEEVINTFSDDNDLFDTQKSIPIDKQRNEEAFARVEYLTFGGNKIPMTDDDLKALEEAYQKYIAEFTTHYGFVLSLVEKWNS